MSEKSDAKRIAELEVGLKELAQAMDKLERLALSKRRATPDNDWRWFYCGGHAHASRQWAREVRALLHGV